MRRAPIAGSPLSAADLTMIEQHLPQIESDMQLLQTAAECGMSVQGLQQELEAHRQFLSNVRDRFFPLLPVDQTPEHIT